MPTAQSVIQTFNDYGNRSTLHGLSHLYQSKTMWGRMFWFSLTFMGTCACFFHVYKTVENYLDTPVTSIILDEGEKSRFPDVTICNLKPISESLSVVAKQQIYDHIENYWKFFDNWFPEKRHRRLNETRSEYKTRLKSLFKRYFEIMWVSDDTRDIGMMDKIMLLSCIYKGEPCTGKVFKLIQNFNNWNCYDFIPSDRDIEGSGHESGLELILYTDSNFGESIYQFEYKYRRKKSREDEIKRPYTLREYIKEGKRTLNQVVAGNKFEADGLQIIIHRDEDFPTLSDISYEVANGVSATIEFDATKKDSLSRPPIHECNDGQSEKVSYVTSFGAGGMGVRRKEFRFGQAERVVSLKQKHIYSKCKCYSHRFPFSVEHKNLCYFVNTTNMLSPSQNVQIKVECHDEAYKEAESKTLDFMEQTKAFQPCEMWKYSASKVQSFWPRRDDYTEFINSLILPAYMNGSEFKGISDTHKHHMLKNLTMKNALVSREDVILHSLLTCTESLTNWSIVKRKIPISDFWCLDPTHLIQNVARVWIKPKSPAAQLYKEMYSYDWPEALSEIGGIFGLWVGMSLLTFFEFIELVFLMLTERDDPHAQLNHDHQTGNSRRDLEILLQRQFYKEVQQKNTGESNCMGLDGNIYSSIPFADSTSTLKMQSLVQS